LGAYGPRLGFAYELTPKTVIRAGYGLFYAPIIGNNLSFQGYTSSIGISSLDGGLTPVFGIDQGWPSSLVKLPPFIDPTVANNQNTATSFTCAGCSGRLPRTSQWQINIQRTIKDVLFEASYVGTVGHGITNNAMVNLNQVNPQYLRLGNLLTTSIDDPAVRSAGFSPPYADFKGTLAQALRAFPQYQSITTYNTPTGNSTYHGFLFKSEKRFSNGLQFLVSYSASKTITDVAFDANGVLPGPQDQFNRRAEKSIANTDRPQRLVLSYYYELPWGAGKAHLNKGPLSKIFGGFAIASIHEYQAGGPLRITVPNNLPIFGGHLRPNRVGSSPIRIGPGRGDFQPVNGLTGQAGDVLLDRNAFSSPEPFAFGNLGVYLPSVRGFGSRNEDISVTKKHRFHESRSIEFRGDFFNAFNRRNLNGPVTDLTNPNFGRITGQGNPRAIQLGMRVDF
jgi:trimeric autotransporter adhesin